METTATSMDQLRAHATDLAKRRLHHKEHRKDAADLLDRAEEAVAGLRKRLLDGEEYIHILEATMDQHSRCDVILGNELFEVMAIIGERLEGGE